MKFIPKGLLDKKSSLVQVKAWHQTGAKSTYEPVLTKFFDAIQLQWVNP